MQNLSSTCSQRGFLVNQPATPGKDEAQVMTVGSGRTCLESYRLLTRHGASLRTCVASLLLNREWYSSVVALTWKASATKSSRLLFRLAPSVRRTEGTECGYWPMLKTPRASEGEGGVMKIRPGGDGHYKYKLRDQIAMLPTPKDGIQNSLSAASGITKQDRDGQGPGLKLQPSFVEWMQGFPIGWTDLNL